MAELPTRKRRTKREAEVAYVSFVSLMDMLTIILIFLLHSFSATGETFTTTETFRLPVSTSTQPIEPRLAIQITKDSIIVEGEKIAELNAIEEGKLLITQLFDKLNIETQKSIFIAGINPSLVLSREVVILGDRTIPFSILQKVMYTCGQVGYNNISLAVITSEG